MVDAGSPCAAAPWPATLRRRASSFLFPPPPSHPSTRVKSERPATTEMVALPRAPSPTRACTRGCAHGHRVAARRCLCAPPPSVAGVNDGRRRDERERGLDTNRLRCSWRKKRRTSSLSSRLDVDGDDGVLDGGGCCCSGGRGRSRRGRGAACDGGPPAIGLDTPDQGAVKVRCAVGPDGWEVYLTL
uniref:Uncharacterized protein n=1 Tax=Oryza sativa subsp. japonica TaxID=39947 RepID=Q6Z9T2_ORYSJ|nr:hypothetical protein [Oryza sativa Japonica Group]